MSGKFSKMEFYEIFVRSPVNGLARSMLSAKVGCEERIKDDELLYLIDRLNRKRRLLNAAIGVDTKAKRKNLRYKMNKNKRTYRESLNPRGVDEWSRNGEAIQRLYRELERRKGEQP